MGTGNARRGMGWLVLILVAAIAGCIEDPTVDDNETQVWAVQAISNGAVITEATAECLPGGACTAKSWKLLSQETFGCDHIVDFDVQFSGSNVRLFNFRNNFASTCSNTSTQGDGTGVANAGYPSATTASGTVTLSTVSPIGPSGGTGEWVAVRME